MKASQSETDFQIIVECFIIWKSNVLRVLFFNLRNGSSCKKVGGRVYDGGGDDDDRGQGKK